MNRNIDRIHLRSGRSSSKSNCEKMYRNYILENSKNNRCDDLKATQQHKKMNMMDKFARQEIKVPKNVFPLCRFKPKVNSSQTSSATNELPSPPICNENLIENHENEKVVSNIITKVDKKEINGQEETNKSKKWEKTWKRYMVNGNNRVRELLAERTMELEDDDIDIAADGLSVTTPLPPLQDEENESEQVIGNEEKWQVLISNFLKDHHTLNADAIVSKFRRSKRQSIQENNVVPEKIFEYILEEMITTYADYMEKMVVACLQMASSLRITSTKIFLLNWCTRVVEDGLFADMKDLYIRELEIENCNDPVYKKKLEVLLEEDKNYSLKRYKNNLKLLSIQYIRNMCNQGQVLPIIQFLLEQNVYQSIYFECFTFLFLLVGPKLYSDSEKRAYSCSFSYDKIYDILNYMLLNPMVCGLNDDHVPKISEIIKLMENKWHPN